MKGSRLLAIGAFTSSVLCACGTTDFAVGHNFDPDAFTSQVARGKTTRSEVRSWLGEPSSVGPVVETNGGQYEEWTYYFAKGSIPALIGPSVKVLQVKFDSSGVVQGYSVSRPTP